MKRNNKHGRTRVAAMTARTAPDQAAERAWKAIAQQQGWNAQSQLTVLTGYLRKSKLFTGLAQHAQAVANAEKGAIL